MRCLASLKRAIVCMQHYAGRFDYLKVIEPERINRLVFVCRGNVCRSPFAEGLAKMMGFEAVSCGIDVQRSAPAEAIGISAAQARGINISSHISRSINDVLLYKYDCLIAMDPSHLKLAKTVAMLHGSQVTLLGLWNKKAKIEIPDPYGKSFEDFNACYEEIHRSLKGFREMLNLKGRGCPVD